MMPYINQETTNITLHRLETSN